MGEVARTTIPLWPSARTSTNFVPIRNDDPADSNPLPPQPASPSFLPAYELEKRLPEDRRVTLWHKIERRKISGNAAPKQRNLSMYLLRNPHVEVYNGQDGLPYPSVSHQARAPEEKDPDMRRVTLWHKLEQRKLSGNAAPFERNLQQYLLLHPEMEVFTGQDQKYRPLSQNNNSNLQSQQPALKSQAPSPHSSSSSSARGSHFTPQQPNSRHEQEQKHLHRQFQHFQQFQQYQLQPQSLSSYSFPWPGTLQSCFTDFGQDPDETQPQSDYSISTTTSDFGQAPQLFQRPITLPSPPEPIISFPEENFDIVAVCDVQPFADVSPVSTIDSKSFLIIDASLDHLAPPDIFVLDP